jgi:hypothetical protein
MFDGLSDRSKLVLQLLFTLILCVGVVAFIVFLQRSRSPHKDHRVDFRVEASVGGVAIITLDAGDAASITEPITVSVPWTKSIRVAPGTEVYLTAANPTQTGKLTCIIMLDKTLWKKATTTAPKDGVACAGIVP